MRWPIISPVVFHLSSTRYIKGGQMNFSRISAASIFVSLVLAGTGMTSPVQAQQANMTFFVTSAGKGNGADLGGLEGADAHCAALAKAAGAKATNWHAYLSTTFSPARIRRACSPRRAAIPPAATGRRAAKARRSSATMTCRD